MAKVLNIFKILALIAFSILCVYSTLLVRKLTTVDTTAINQVTTNLNTSLNEINRPCEVKYKTCGSIADFNRTLATARGAIGQIEIAAKHENKNLTTLDAQEHTLFLDAHNTLLAGQNTLNQGSILLTTANQTVLDTQPVLTQGELALAGLTTNLDSLHTLIANTAIPKIITALQVTSEQAAGTSANLNATTADIKQAVHDYLHPKWYEKLETWAIEIGTRLTW